MSADASFVGFLFRALAFTSKRTVARRVALKWKTWIRGSSPQEQSESERFCSGIGSASEFIQDSYREIVAGVCSLPYLVG